MTDIIQNPASMAKDLFYAFQEFNLPESESINDFEKIKYNTQNLNDNQILFKDKTVMLKFFDAYEKFSIPQVNSYDSLASLSTNSSSSNLEELMNHDATLYEKLIHAVERFTISAQGHSRLPGAGAPPKPALTFEQASFLQKFLIAVDAFIHPPANEDGNEDQAQIPKFC